MSHSNRKVAIIQNRIQPGGRFQVMAQMIAILNEDNIEPELLCFRCRLDVKQVKRYYSKELRFKVRIVQGEVPLPFEWNILWFNHRVSRYLGEYDLVINHNNTSFGLATNRPLISYIHYSRKARLDSGLRDVHQPELGKVPRINVKKDFFNLMSFIYKWNKRFPRNEILLGNSEFTKEAILNSYPLISREQISVIYPPVDLRLDHDERDISKNQVVSLARFTSAKRQLEQIMIAEGLPEMQFILLGFVGDQAYYDKCLKYLKDKSVKNVTIITNASSQQVSSILKKARFFIHSMRNEPFGITSVQAIASGCIPIVHNSGGQREIVIQKDLRYENIEDAVYKIKNLFNEDKTSLNLRLALLKKHIQKFSDKEFSRQFVELLQNLYNEI